MQDGALFSPGSPESAADRIAALIADADLRRRQGERGRETILSRFAPDPALAMLAEELRRLAP